MRCNNCGWLNSDEDSRCVKCNNSLAAAKPVDPVKPEPVEVATNGEEPVSTLAGGIIPCPACDYPASSRVQHCPMCGNSLKGGGEKPVKTGSGADSTLPPFREPDEAPPLPNRTSAPEERLPQPVSRPEMVLERLGNNPEESATALSFTATDGEVNVNRQQLDQNNFTITSRTQASFVFRDGKWWLLDRSDLKTTFVRVKEAVELRDGDVIQMGDRRFIFHPTDPVGRGGAGQ
jgi:hypothetical protein